MYYSKMRLPLISICLLSTVAFAQHNVIDQDIPLANSLKAKYGKDVDFVCLTSKTTVTFKYTTSKAVLSPVSATESNDEKLIALKDNYDFYKYLFYNDFSDVGEIKGYGKNNRPTDIYASDYAAGSNNDFYVGAHCRRFALSFTSLGEKQRYTSEQFFTDMKRYNRIQFSDDYPYLERTVVFDVPKWLNVEFKEENLSGYDITKTVTEDPKTHDAIYTFTAKNIPEMHHEPSMPNMWSMFPHVLILVKSYTTPAGETVNMISSMDDLYKYVDGLVKEAGNKDDVIKPLVTKLTQDKKTDIDKIKAIYYWVQDNIRYIAFENGISGQKPAPCQDVYSERYGDCKGMANLMTVMLKDAGFDARRTWIGVEGIPYDFSTPFFGLFNHCICTLVYNGKHYYLDGVEKYTSFGDNSDWIQGKLVLTEDGDKHIEERIPVETIDRSKEEFTQDVTVSGTDLLAGKETDVYNGEEKVKILTEYNDAPTNEKSTVLKEMAVSDDKNMEVTGVAPSDLQNREIPVTLSYNFTVKNQVSVFDNEMYVSIDDQKWFENLIFDSLRHQDYSFRFRKNFVQTINFSVPAGYTVKHLPDAIDIKKPGYTFKISVTQKDNKVIYKKEFTILDPIIKKADFKTWNDDLAQVKKIYDDQLVLAKK